ncbi:MAG: hypothetical protein Q7U30_03335 [Methylicorpusculum sp.]|nr:hypothetical protein [Methylicorpusculum sp.]
MTDGTSAAADSGMLINQTLFGLAMLAFLVLLIVEKRKPFRHFPMKVNKESFVTNQYLRQTVSMILCGWDKT